MFFLHWKSPFSAVYLSYYKCIFIGKGSILFKYVRNNQFLRNIIYYSRKILLDTTAVLIVKTKTVRYNACKVDF